MPTLIFESVCLGYNSEKGETGALRGVDLQIDTGAFVALVGPSGCGKSTLLSLAAGLLQPDEGRVLLDGQPVAGQKTRIGYMLQRDHLFDWLTIEQNAMVGLRVRGEETPENRRRVAQLLAQCGLKDFAQAYPAELSGGMRQRAALVRTLAPDPAVLLLDEPFSALDYQTRLSVAQDVYQVIKRHRKTALLVTHDINEAVSMADRVAVLTKRPGRIKRIVPIELTGDPLSRRMQPGFGDYFNLLWKELEHDDA